MRLQSGICHIVAVHLRQQHARRVVFLLEIHFELWLGLNVRCCAFETDSDYWSFLLNVVVGMGCFERLRSCRLVVVSYLLLIPLQQHLADCFVFNAFDEFNLSFDGSSGHCGCQLLLGNYLLGLELDLIVLNLEQVLSRLTTSLDWG